LRRVHLVFPTPWDDRQLAACRERWSDRFQVTLDRPSDLDCPADFDVLGYVDRLCRQGGFEGVMSSSDYPGATAAAAVATRLGLPGSRPERILRCSHKYYCRLAQRQAVPEAVPPFVLVPLRDPEAVRGELRFPCFVKPVKGAFSILARRAESWEELADFLGQPAVREFTEGYLAIFHDLAATLGGLAVDGRHFLAEGLLQGRQVTVEGYCLDPGEVEVVGIVDSLTQSETGSFVAFIYPSSLPVEIQDRMAAVARRVLTALELSWTLFNVEMMYDEEADRVAIIEVNPRLCGQFADLYEKVDGRHTYEIALSLAVGERPGARRGVAAYRMAASYPLRVFAPVRVLRAPGPAEVRGVEERFPGTLVWSEVEAGQTLTDFVRLEDGASARYGVLNLGADDARGLEERRDEMLAALGFAFAPT